MRQRALQIALGILWAALGLSFLVLWWFSDIAIVEVPQLLADWVEAFGTLPAIGCFLVLYTLRPLLLFPSTIMGVASGLTFGPLLGCGVTMTGELLGAGMAFSLARLLGRNWARQREPARIARLNRRLSKNGLLSVCIMRLVMLPFDSISYACGLSSIRLADFLIGTLLGGIFYVLTVTLLGGSAAVGLDGTIQFAGWTISARTLTLIFSGLSFAAGVAIAWTLRHRYVLDDPLAKVTPVADAPGSPNTTPFANPR